MPSTYRHQETTMKDMMNQCKLERNGSTYSAFIDSKHAIVGKVVDIRVDGEWQRGWIVLDVYQPAVAADTVQARERDYKSHRRATDV